MKLLGTYFQGFKRIVGLKVLNKVYTTANPVKKIIRSSLKKWRPMVTALKVSKDMNNMTLEGLVSYLRSHKIDLEEDEPHGKEKYVVLKSKGNIEKTKAFQAEEEEESEEVSDEEDELSLLSIRVNQVWRKRHKKTRGIRRTNGHFESTSRQKKYGFDKDVICFECKEPGHYVNECPKLEKENPNNKFLKDNKKVLMVTWEYSESS